jgi:hypothetical protein
MWRRLSLFGLTAVLLALSNQPAAAQQRPRGLPAATSPAEAGPDFLFQGEYAGWIEAPGQSREHVGLQVIALGDGKFAAVRYPGGLPGSGWDGGIKRNLRGRLLAASSRSPARKINS